MWSRNITTATTDIRRHGVDPRLKSIFGQAIGTTLETSGSRKGDTGTIAGGVVGGVAVVCIVAGLIFWCVKRKRSQRYEPASTAPPLDSPPLKEPQFEMQATGKERPAELTAQMKPQEMLVHGNHRHELDPWHVPARRPVELG
jgi:hypothetical protein